MPDLVVGATGMQLIKCSSVAVFLGLVLVSANSAQTTNPNYQLPQHRVELESALAAFVSWAQGYSTNADTKTGPQTLKEGLTLARSRRAALRELIQADPRKAVAGAIPQTIRNLLPPQITAELEVPVSGVGDLLVVFAIPLKGAPAAGPVRRFVRLNGGIYHAFVYGRRLSQTTKYRIPLHGVVLGDEMALDDKVLCD